MRSVWIKAAALLAAVWLIAGGVIYWARAAKPTPEKLAAYMEKHPIDGKGGGDRAKTIEKVADQLNQLSFDERREFRMERKLDQFAKALTPDEQGRFLDLTLPTGFKQMMEALNKMDREKRKEFVEKALEDMKKHQDERPGEEIRDNKMAAKIIDQGFKSFYSEASAETKMDVAPLIEQLQRNLEGWR